MPLFAKVCYNRRGANWLLGKLNMLKLNIYEIKFRKELVEYGNKYDKTYKCHKNL